MTHSDKGGKCERCEGHKRRTEAQAEVERSVGRKAKWLPSPRDGEDYDGDGSDAPRVK